MQDSTSHSSGFLATLLCSEVLPSSPPASVSSNLQTNPSDGSYDLHRPRTVQIDYDAELYGDRALNRKLAEQRIGLQTKDWSNSLSHRQEYWIQAFRWYRERNCSQASLQMAISFVDRFMSKFVTPEFGGNVNQAPLDCIFEAALIIVEQLLDDDPDLSKLVPVFSGDPNEPRSPRSVGNIQIAVKLMLQVTCWEVIDWTPASFIPHYLQQAQLRQEGDTVYHQQILAVATLFMIDAEIASTVPASAIAALAVILQSYLVVDAFYDEEDSGNSDMLDPASFLFRTVDIVARAGQMSPEYFNDMADFALTRLVESKQHDGFGLLDAAKFCGIWKGAFGRSLAMLERVSGVAEMSAICSFGRQTPPMGFPSPSVECEFDPLEIII